MGSRCVLRRGPYFTAPNRVICSRLWLAVLLSEGDGVDGPMGIAEDMDAIRSRPVMLNAMSRAVS